MTAPCDRGSETPRVVTSGPPSDTSASERADPPQAKGDLEGAAVIFAEELEGCAALYGAGHTLTAESAASLSELLNGMGKGAQAAILREQYGI